jgi:hypothetical protein
MTWAAGKAALVARLQTVTITSPVSFTTEIIYETPPAAITDDICWVLFAPRIRTMRVPGGWLEKQYRYRARLFVYDENHEFAALMVEQIVEATIDAFNNQSALRTGGFQHINGPDVDEPGQLQLAPGGRLWHIADCFFDIEYGEAKTFG